MRRMIRLLLVVARVAECTRRVSDLAVGVVPAPQCLELRTRPPAKGAAVNASWVIAIDPADMGTAAAASWL